MWADAYPGMWHIRLVKLKHCWIKNWKGQVIWTWLASWRFFGYSKTPTCNFKRFCLSKRLHNYKDSKCWSYRWKGEKKKKNEGRLKIKHRFHNKKKKKILICITLGLAWRPEGKRRPSRIKTQWRRIVEVVEEERHTDLRNPFWSTKYVAEASQAAERQRKAWRH